LDLNEIQKESFAMGFLGGLNIAPFMGAPDDGRVVVSFRTCTAEMTARQLAAIIEKYIRANPGFWHQQLQMSAFNSLAQACHTIF
jgi:hypothetical protein